MEDILDESLHADKLRTIPNAFDSPPAYFAAFAWLLIEETRGQLQQALSELDAKVCRRIQLRGVGDGRGPGSLQPPLRTVRFEFEGVGQTSGGEKAFKPTDVILLSNLKPERQEDLQREGVLYTLGVLRGDRDDSPGDCAYQEATVYLPDGSRESEALCDPANRDGRWHATCLAPLATSLRIWRALHSGVDGSAPRAGFGLTSQVLGAQQPTTGRSEGGINRGAGKAESPTGEGQMQRGLAELKSALRNLCEGAKLNPSQRDAVLDVVSAWQAPGLASVNLVQGPPGTGKTSTVVAMLRAFAGLGARALVSAPTNVAVSEVVLRLLRELRADGARALPTGFKGFGAGDIALIGNKDSLDVTDGPLNEVYLPARAKRLAGALSPVAGWVARVHSLTEFLRSADEQYRQATEGGESARKADQPISLQGFCIKQLQMVHQDLEENAAPLCNDLPSASPGLASFRDSARELLQNLQTLRNAVGALPQASKALELYFTANPRPKDESLESDARRVSAAVDRILGISMRPSALRVPINIGPSAAQLETSCLQNAALVFCTVSCAGRSEMRSAGRFDLALIDEAAQLVEAETAIILTGWPGLKLLVLVGDHLQLPATVTSRLAKEHRYDRSLFERLKENGHRSVLLNTQYRMHPEISRWPLGAFYGEQVQDGRNVTEGRYNQAYVSRLLGPYAFIDAAEGREEKDPGGASKCNRMEADLVLHLLRKLRSACEAAGVSADVGVITPYKRQVELLAGHVPAVTRGSQSGPGLTVEVRSVDGFQGREKDVIIFSAVRANRAGVIGFLGDERRLNVALTRAKFALWIVGDAQTLQARDPVWKSLVEDAVTRGARIQAGSHKSMQKVVKNRLAAYEDWNNILTSNSSMFEGLPWKIVFSKELRDALVGIKSREARLKVLFQLQSLAQGKRPKFASGDADAGEDFRDLIHLLPVYNYSLIWTVDVDRATNTQVHTQVLRAWHLVLSSQRLAFIRRLESSYRTYSPGYLHRCRAKRSPDKNGLVLPLTWDRDDRFVWFKKDRAVEVSEEALEHSGEAAAAGLEEAAVDESLLLLKFYEMSPGAAHVLMTAADGSELELPFEVSEQEAAIVQYPKSVFILGRSGTGKTTVITTRLLQKEQRFKAALAAAPSAVPNPPKPDAGAAATVEGGADPPRLRQLMVTLSPKLCAAIRQSLNRTMRCMEAADSGTAQNEATQPAVGLQDVMLDETEEARLLGDIPDDMTQLEPGMFPLVITFRKFVTMLDGGIARPFFPKQGPTGAAALGSIRIGEGAQSSDDDESIMADDDGLSPGDGEESGADDGADVRFAPGKKRCARKARDEWRQEVDYDRFVGSDYWPHTDMRLRKKFDPSAVYTEIISTIKGSQESLRFPQGRLSREAYLKLSEARSSSFSPEQRSEIYQLFEQYERRKRALRDYDIADVVGHVYRELTREGYRLVTHQFVYVDEVQDLTQAQLALFKFVCAHIEGGFVFAGDTAQTIARGVGFRFEDVRRLFYSEFLRRDCSVRERAESGGTGVPDVHQLTTNFRTHSGIVRVADSVIRLLVHFFPAMVDRLQPESSLIAGEMPTVLHTGADVDFLAALFGKGSFQVRLPEEAPVGGAPQQGVHILYCWAALLQGFSKKLVAGTGGCEFGAEQVVLVRDAAAKRRLVDRVGTDMLVLTVHECKGLEFQDVLVYNFFSDSPLGVKWRVVYNYLNNVRPSSAHSEFPSPELACPPFDPVRHHLLCSELKQLYVVLTRARQRLWVFDESPELRRPMLDFWTGGSSLVQLLPLTPELVASFQSRSTPEEWARRGRQFFNERGYDSAVLCFERAGDAFHATWARAAGLRQAADRAPDTRVAAASYARAAELFLELDKGESAGDCLRKARRFADAGAVFKEKCAPPLWGKAAECFEMAGSWAEAAEAYSEARARELALRACLKGRQLQLGVGLLKEWEKEGGFDQTLVDLKADYLNRCALHYHRRKDTSLMLECVLAFPSQSKRRQFLERRDYFDEVIAVETADGNFAAAARLFDKKGDRARAADMYEAAAEMASPEEERALASLVGAKEQSPGAPVGVEESARALVKRAAELRLQAVRLEMFWSEGRGVWPIRGREDHAKILDLVERLCLQLGDGAARLQLGVRALRALAGLHGEDVKALWIEAMAKEELSLALILLRQALSEACAEAWSRADRFHKEDRGAEQQGRNRPFETESFEQFLAKVKSAAWAWEEWYGLVSRCLTALERALNARTQGDDPRVLAGVERFFEVGPSGSPGARVVEDTGAGWCKGVPITRLPNQGSKGEITAVTFRKQASRFLYAEVVKAGANYRALLEASVELLTPPVALPPPVLMQQSPGQALTADRVQIISRLWQLADSVPESVPAECAGACAARLWDCLLPKITSAGAALEAAALRGDPRVRAMLTSVAEAVAEGRSPVNGGQSGLVRERVQVSWDPARLAAQTAFEERDVLPLEAVGQLQLLIPFLDADWFESARCAGTFGGRLHVIPPPGFLEDLRTRALRFGASWELAAAAALQRGPNLQATGEDRFAAFNGAWFNGKALLELFSPVWLQKGGYPNPFTFVRLVERAVVQSCAAVSQLNHLVLPTTWVLDHMEGPVQESLFTLLLESGCTSDQQYQLRGLLRQLLEMVIQYLDNLETWIARAGLNRVKEEPILVVRLLVVLLTLAANPQVDPGRHFLGPVCNAMNFLVRNPVPGVPVPVIAALQQAAEHRRFLSVSDVGSALARTLAAIGGRLTVLQRERWVLPRAKRADFHWAAKLRRVIVSAEVNGRNVFSIGALLSAAPKFCVRDWASGDSLGAAVPSAESAEAQGPNNGADSESGQPALEEEAVQADIGTESDAQCPQPDDEDAEQDADRSRASEQQPVAPPSAALLTLAERLPRHVRERLAFLLMRARARLAEDRDPVKRLANEVRRAFARQHLSCPSAKSAEYRARFRAEACPLQVKSEHFLEALRACIRALKAGSDETDELDETLDIEEELARLLPFFNPRHKAHLDCDVRWLDGYLLRPTRAELARGQTKLAPRLASSVTSSDLGEEGGRCRISTNQGPSRNKQKGNQKRKQKGKVF
ncbi:tRNA-splicing endonuclease positive effector [Klebsormidium nitens]|uniref:tRNA-splicing endonuclease positive effector n=1 Tax=Klebsormidium nitens TaxID=105231 RepID=A0A1Y1HS56_KLENI|nr:tRNA-splicing endonuclease positive effector [Klebsormidium nitens]|eukprot:GAQ79821.1 tRNA-splicing endonuclease positive effector [Klebsormidium nitens]